MRPVILHVILPCSLAAGQESGCETTCYVLQKKVKRGQQHYSSIFQYCHSMSIEGVLAFYRTIHMQVESQKIYFLLLRPYHLQFVSNTPGIDCVPFEIHFHPNSF